MRSIERYLVAWIIGALSLGLALIALVTYLVTIEELNEAFDDDLKNVATAMAAYRHSGDALLPAQAVLSAPPGSGKPEDTDIVTQIWDGAGLRVFTSDPSVSLPFSPTHGLSFPVSKGEAWIVYTAAREHGVAQAAQRKAGRSEAAQESAAKVLPPMLLLIVVVGGLMMFALRRGLLPLDDAARQVAARSAHSLEPIPTAHVPGELMPLAVAINGLMQRLSTALSAQRRFLADAAHELRTPATAIRLQAQLLEMSSDSATRAAAMGELQSGIQRSQRLIEQLLQVARSGEDGEPLHLQPLDLSQLVRSIVATMSIKADQKGIDLGARAANEVLAIGDTLQLTVLLNNLVENALRYTPAGGLVDVEALVLGGKPTLRVIDNGPGILPGERRRVFDRFYRGERLAAFDTEGSGLGLSIVEAIAQRHDAEVSLHTPRNGIGLEARVVFKAALTGANGHANAASGAALKKTR